MYRSAVKVREEERQEYIGEKGEKKRGRSI